MQLDKYRKVFTTRGFPLVMGLGLLAKLPIVAIPIVLTLHVATGLGHGYGQAGLVITAWTTGFTLGSPVQGHLISRYGLRPVLAVSVLAQGVFWGTSPQLTFPALMAGALCSGLMLVPGSTVVRLAIGGLIPRAHRHTAFAVDSVLTEVAYMSGPPLAALLATQLSSKGLLVTLCLALVMSGGALVVFNPRIEEESSRETRGAKGAKGAEGAEGAVSPGGARLGWLSTRLAVVLACSVAAGAIVTGYEVAVIGTLRSAGELEWAGLVLLASGVYSLLGGLVFGALSRNPSLPLVIGLLAVATMPLGLVGTHWWVLVIVAAPAAALWAPGFAATADAASRLAGDGHRATVMSVYSSALAAGSALGAPLAGAAFDFGGSEVAFATAGGLGLAVALAAFAVLGRHRPEPAREADDAADGEPDGGEPDGGEPDGGEPDGDARGDDGTSAVSARP